MPVLGLHDWSCVVHVHSTFSDGTATVPEIAEAARRTGADAVLLTDHDTLGARRAGFERWHGSVLVLVGHEVSPREGHFLAFGLDEEIEHAGMTELEICRAVEAGGGLGFAAHPFSEGSRMSRRIGRPHPWRSLEEHCGTGIELWSLLTDAAEAWRSPREALAFLRRPEDHLDGPPAHHLRAWDALCRRRRVVAIGGLDAHQHGVRLGGRVVSPIPNERYFGCLRTHVLTERPPSGDVGADRAQLHQALREGRCYLAVSALEPGGGVEFWAEDGDAALPLGGEGRAGRWTLRARLPRRARLRLVRDGEPVLEREADRLEGRAAEPGAYRLEARLVRRGRERTWIVTNPIYLRGSESKKRSERSDG